MTDFFKDATFDFKCPNCQSNIPVKVSSVGSTINCPHCNQAITLQDKGFSSGIQNANKSLDKFLKGLK